MESGGGYVGLLSFCSFIFSVIAAVLAIDLYALLRTGRAGATWRVLIIASVMFALMHALRLAELLNFGVFPLAHLSEIVELMFVMALAYAFYLQRKVFGPRDHADAPRAAQQPRPAPGPESALDRALANAPSSATASTDATNASHNAEPDALMDNSGLALEDEEEEESDSSDSEWARLSGQADRRATKRASHVLD